MSPAPTVRVFWPCASASARRPLRVVARYSAPPAGVPLTSPPLPVGGSSAPWKSLNEKNRALAMFPLLSGFAACEPVVDVAMPAAVSAATATSRVPLRSARRVLVMSGLPARILANLGTLAPAFARVKGNPRGSPKSRRPFTWRPTLTGRSRVPWRGPDAPQTRPPHWSEANRSPRPRKGRHHDQARERLYGRGSVAGVALATMGLRGLAVATGPTAVGATPTALNPPPSTACHGSRQGPTGASPTPVRCWTPRRAASSAGAGAGAYEVIDQATRRVKAERWYTDGNLVSASAPTCSPTPASATRPRAPPSRTTSTTSTPTCSRCPATWTRPPRCPWSSWSRRRRATEPCSSTSG